MDDQSHQPSNASAASSGEAISPETLKLAYKAFKKRLKLTRLDHESRIGRSPMSSGGNSSIVGIVPPDQYPRAVWDELVQQGKLKRAGGGLYTMP
ncbi:MAG TPA: hypothetical protein VHZ24_21035 [Pirellulales bacterium]|nr:hypothetical protein [Pirellulales bacterium]